jgi:hypothetical protein
MGLSSLLFKLTLFLDFSEINAPKIVIMAPQNRILQEKYLKTPL